VGFCYGETGLTDALRSPIIHMLILVRCPDPFPDPAATVIIPVPAVRPVAVVPVPAMNLAPMLVMVAISVPSDGNF
jgi:hypothetical protein